MVISIRTAIIVSLAMVLLAIAGSAYTPDRSAEPGGTLAYEASSTTPSMSYEVIKGCPLCIAAARACAAACGKVISKAKTAYKTVKAAPRTVSKVVSTSYKKAKTTYRATKGIRPTFSGPSLRSSSRSNTFFQIGLKNRERKWSHSIGLHPPQHGRGVHFQRTSKNTGQNKARHKRWP